MEGQKQDEEFFGESRPAADMLEVRRQISSQMLVEADAVVLEP